MKGAGQRKEDRKKEGLKKEDRVSGDVSLFCLSRDTRTAVRVNDVRGNGDRLIGGEVVSAANSNDEVPIDD